MYRILSYFFTLLTVYHLESKAEYLDDISTYFEHDITRQLSEKWKTYRRSIEDVIQRSLGETFNTKGMNIYMHKNGDELQLTKGFLVTDNLVHVLFTDMNLTQLPSLKYPEVSFDVAGNVLGVDSLVSDILVQANYVLFKNDSDTVMPSDAFPINFYKTSPFMVNPMSNKGEVIITAEGCVLSGSVMTRLERQSLNLGHDCFELKNCKFSIEISNSLYSASPPVIAPYFNEKQGDALKNLIRKPIVDELITKLQGLVYSYVNSSAIFGKDLAKFRKHQSKVFEDSLKFLTLAVQNMNKMTVTNDTASKALSNIKIKWMKQDNGKPTQFIIDINNSSISGLDSAYSAQIGGASKTDSLKVCETIRFASIQVRGTGQIRIERSLDYFIFSGEIRDVEVHISHSIQPKNEEQQSGTFQVKVIGWRSFDFYGPQNELVSPYSLVNGILLNQLPTILSIHLEKFLI